MIPFVVSPGGVFAQYVMPMISPFVAFSSFFNTKEVVDSDDSQDVDFNSLTVAYIALVVQGIVYIIAVLFL